MQRAESPAPSTIGSSVFSSSPDWGRRGELRARCGIICPKRVEGAKEHNDCASERARCAVFKGTFDDSFTVVGRRSSLSLANNGEMRKSGVSELRKLSKFPLLFLVISFRPKSMSKPQNIHLGNH